ncbi:uncharacterized protein UV8b_05031 [Ustilaginoidea virens]|uniref:Ras-GAP domain-containing protein n=1 Tax=Ustilaginoidea virens TaxID=1159556 RepID=A0A8E5HSY0_USTVR|nr:uncharacterized protein UV8b_05031 [Ustilaginoidea virens]QUC20790.1 hypothetical protein UV8b_05031 [Ustilaginoidea virens]
MSGDAVLVGCLVERILSRLPCRTGSLERAFEEDEILQITKATLLDLSTNIISVVIDSLLGVLEGLSRPYNCVASHPPHVLISEQYVLSLAAASCTANWRTVCTGDSGRSELLLPDKLDQALVNRWFDIFQQLLEPMPDDFVLPAQTLITQLSGRNFYVPRPVAKKNRNPSSDADCLEKCLVEFDSHIKVLVEFISASSWSSAFEYVRKTIYTIRAASFSEDAEAQTQDIEITGLVTLRLLSFFWIDSTKLGHLIQEIRSSYMHFPRSYQNTMAVVLPLLVFRWIDRHPHEFIRLHSHHKRLDGGGDTLFDMTQTGIDSGRRRADLYPMQIALLLLLPDVFEVASNLREVKSSSLIKKVLFLDNLRKLLRNANERAAYCLVSLVCAARHFIGESDSAVVSYAVDVQDEIRESVFSLSHAGNAIPSFDQDIITGAFIGLFHLDPIDSVRTLVKTCISPTAPESFKIAVIQACSYFAEQAQDGNKFSVLFDNALPFIQSELTSECTKSRKLSGDPIPLNSRKILEILRFLDVYPGPFIHELASQTSSTAFLISFLFFVLSWDLPVRSFATNVARKLLARDGGLVQAISDNHRHDFPADLRKTLWDQSSSIILDLCAHVESNTSMRSISQLREFLSTRSILLKSISSLSKIPNDVTNVSEAATKLETTLLLSLCSPDISICQAATLCIGIVVDEGAQVERYSGSANLLSSTFPNNLVYLELASPAFHFTGLVAFQKRMRGLLRQLRLPTRGVLNAWELAFDRWIHLSRDVSMASAEEVDDRVLSSWRNLSGFLASLGGICTYAQASRLDEAIGDLPWIDKLNGNGHEEPLLSQFLKLAIRLLGCENIKVRETMREVLSIEISPTLYAALFKALESELDVLLAGLPSSVDNKQEKDTVFAGQAVSVLKSMVEKIESPSDLASVSSIHLGVLTLNFTKFLNGAPESGTTMRVKIKICHLCEAVTKRKEHLNLRDDIRIRNQLLEHIYGWIARPYAVNSDQTANTGIRQDELRRVQKDLDKACLKTLADLTFRLPLQAADCQTDAGMSEFKSQMFHTYFNSFLSLLSYETQEPKQQEYPYGAAGREESASNSDIVISILSNLLSANIDVGLKNSLNIGYHENVEIRAAFVQVLCNVLTQGTEFNSLTDSIVSDKYMELLNLLITDFSLPVSMSAICPASEVDELTICLLTIFEQRGLIFGLLEALIRHEIDRTDNETEILRRTCVATKMLSVYAKWKGATYLKTTLQKVVERLMHTSQDLDLELDPARVSAPEELQKNATQLQIVAKVFMEDICASTTNVPSPFRRICAIISKAVHPRFPNAKYTAVGAFIFLRFFCPAIVAPEAEGLISAPPTKELRRGLLLIAKVIQSLANNVLFGTKEPYMFPLNPFLVQNIHLITGFLREISVPPPQEDAAPNSDAFDFSSSVTLHRFLYDHWDYLRQTLIAQEKGEFLRISGESSRGILPFLEPLRILITNLGPPPLAISWNRPQISRNSPILYSRFQNFMLHNAFRSAESFTSRAVYGGGASKDGLSMVCMILRHIETESIDYDTLLYCYLKIASRLWHEPFGLFIDATCYNGRSEPSDEFFSKLDLLTTSELSHNFSRIYIYNMNNAFKRCFRRLLRNSTREETSIFHPNHVEYNLISSMQELQDYFHLGQLDLPKETIDVVKETRYVFQQVTRLSKSKGKVEVVIKVGSHFVQITTVKRQEVLAGFRLSSVINDIFRLGDVEEAINATQIGDESSFGLRADGGKIVMFFTSVNRADILQTIRGAKSKHGKDSRMPKPIERLVRPQDVPGTMLNLALTNLSSPYHVLRLASYNLLGALCRSFEFRISGRLLCNRGLAVPLDPTRFIVSISREVAQAEPQLTSDFLTEFFVSWESIPEEQKPLNLEYMAPWLLNLRTTILVTEADSDKGRDKVSSLVRKLIDIVVLDQNLIYALEQHIWPTISADELLLEVLVDELIKTALIYGNRPDILEILSSMVLGLGTVTLRGRIMCRLRKALNRSSLRPTRLLPDNSVWDEICVLLQFCLALSFDSRVQSQMYLPEIFHLVTMLANTGGHDVRLLVHKILINSIHTMCASFQLEDARSLRLRSILDVLSPPSSVAGDSASTCTALESSPALSTTENLAATLLDICSIAAPSVDVANAWRARWMSLVASSAFQNNPAIQPRAFTVMGYLAKEEVDDDLLYQVLVALRNSVHQFSKDGNSDMLVSITISLSKMMAKLSSASRYRHQLFWLAISLLRLVPPNLFNCTARFLEAILGNIGATGDIRGQKLVALLLDCRTQLEEAALPLDDAYGIHFGADTFHYAVCASLVRGLTDNVTKSMAVRVLSTFLEMTKSPDFGPDGQDHTNLVSPYLALLLARGIKNGDSLDSPQISPANPDSISYSLNCRGIQNIKTAEDKELVLISAVELVDFQYLDDKAQACSLHWLNYLAKARPNVFSIFCGALPTLLDGVLLHGQDPIALKAAHLLLRTLSPKHKYSREMSSKHSLTNMLNELGFDGLRILSSRPSIEDVKGERFRLTEKLIELVIM